MIDERSAEWFSHWFNTVLGNVEQVIKGKRNEVALALMCLFSEGHVLLEDVPGTGKTSLAKAIANSFRGSWSRVQFTPDLLPSDVTGGMIYNQNNATFDFMKGPIFSNVVLADEINRASPKTQSSLLEVMEERQVTVSTSTYAVPRPFVVIATQNPVEQEGTYRLPEAQLDRFLMRLSLGYPSVSDEVAVLKNAAAGTGVEMLQAVMEITDVEQMITVAAGVFVDDAVHDYMVRLTSATRNMPELRLGASPRGSLALMRSTRVLAASQGRTFVTPADVQHVAVPVLAHRLLLSPEAELNGVQVTDLVERVLEQVDLPLPARAEA